MMEKDPKAPAMFRRSTDIPSGMTYAASDKGPNAADEVAAPMKRCQSFDKVWLSHSRNTKLFLGIQEEMESVSLPVSPAGSIENLTKAGLYASDNPSNDISAGSRGQGLYTGVSTAAFGQQKPLTGPANSQAPGSPSKLLSRVSSESAMWKWLTTSTPAAGGPSFNVHMKGPPAPTGGAPPILSTVDGPQNKGLSIKRNLSARDLNVISPTHW